MKSAQANNNMRRLDKNSFILNLHQKFWFRMLHLMTVITDRIWCVAETQFYPTFIICLSFVPQQTNIRPTLNIGVLGKWKNGFINILLININIIINIKKVSLSSWHLPLLNWHHTHQIIMASWSSNHQDHQKDHHNNHDITINVTQVHRVPPLAASPLPPTPTLAAAPAGSSSSAQQRTHNHQRFNIVISLIWLIKWAGWLDGNLLRWKQWISRSIWLLSGCPPHHRRQFHHHHHHHH